MSVKKELLDLIPTIRRFAYSLTGSRFDADDLLQNTVERILSRDIPQNIDLAKWAFRICRNLWIDEYRAAKVRQNAAQNPELHQQKIIDGEHIIYQQITLNEVNSAMNSLPDEQRTVLSLVAIEGLSYKEAAEVLSIPTGTVMSRLARARASLYQHMHLTGAVS